MKMNEIKAGEIFCIEGSKDYPKLRLDVGYVDIRDKIRSVHEVDFNCDLMTEKEVETEFKKRKPMTMLDDIRNLIRELNEKFN